jgi:maleate isomerase
MMSETLRRIGILVPAGDPVVEADFHRYLPPGLTFHTARLFQSETSKVATRENLDRLSGSAPETAKLVSLLEPELIVFCCTSASLYRGHGWDKRLSELITEATGVQATTTSTCVLEAHQALGMKKVFMVTPYPESTNKVEVDFLASNGIEITGFTSFNCEKSKDIGFITPTQIKEKILSNKEKIKQGDGVFVSCTALRTLEVIEDLEKDLGLPVISSNQATLWKTIDILGENQKGIPGGRLFNLSDKGNGGKNDLLQKWKYLFYW